MEKICYMLFNLPRNWDIIPFTLFSTLAMDLADYNLTIAWSNYKMPRFSLYGGTPPKLASGSDNGWSHPRIIPHTELASSVRHRMLPLYHFLSLSLYFYLSLYLTIWPQFIPPTEMTSSVRNRQMANPRPRPDVSQEMWKKEIKTFDNLSFLAKL